MFDICHTEKDRHASFSICAESKRQGFMSLLNLGLELRTAYKTPSEEIDYTQSP